MKKKIAIIGAGIAGLTLANLIKKNSDFEFMLYEKEESLSLDDGFGIQLATNSISILNQIEHLSLNKRSDDINEDIEELIDQRGKLQSQIREIELDGEKRIQSIKESGSNQEAIKQLRSQIDQLTKDIRACTIYLLKML